LYKRIHAAALVLSLALVASFPASADAALLADLTSVVALLGVPCGEVISTTTAGPNDHTVTCKDGNRYRVFINGAGRVVAQKP